MSRPHGQRYRGFSLEFQRKLTTNALRCCFCGVCSVVVLVSVLVLGLRVDAFVVVPLSVPVACVAGVCVVVGVCVVGSVRCRFSCSPPSTLHNNPFYNPQSLASEIVSLLPFTKSASKRSVFALGFARKWWLHQMVFVNW